MPVAASAFGRGAAKQSINHAGKETNALRNELESAFLVVACAAWCRVLLRGALAIIAAAIGVGARHPRKPLM
jgi:hypothetical protein